MQATLPISPFHWETIYDLSPRLDIEGVSYNKLCFPWSYTTFHHFHRPYYQWLSMKSHHSQILYCQLLYMSFHCCNITCRQFESMRANFEMRPCLELQTANRVQLDIWSYLLHLRWRFGRLHGNHKQLQFSSARGHLSFGAQLMSIVRVTNLVNSTGTLPSVETICLSIKALPYRGLPISSSLCNCSLHMRIKGGALSP